VRGETLALLAFQVLEEQLEQRVRRVVLDALVPRASLDSKVLLDRQEELVHLVQLVFLARLVSQVYRVLLVRVDFLAHQELVAFPEHPECLECLDYGEIPGKWDSLVHLEHLDLQALLVRQGPRDPVEYKAIQDSVDRLDFQVLWVYLGARVFQVRWEQQARPVGLVVVDHQEQEVVLDCPDVEEGQEWSVCRAWLVQRVIPGHQV